MSSFSLFGTSLWFHVHFWLLPLDLHTDFSGGRSGVLVFPSLEEFSTVCCDPYKDFSIVNEAEVDVFLEFSCFLYDPMDVGNLISGSSAFSKSSVYTGSSRFTYCWSLAWRILSITLRACEIAIRSSWPEPQSAPGLVYADCIELLHLWLQRI